MAMRASLHALAIAAAGAIPAAAETPALTATEAEGAQIFRRSCQTCHQLGPAARRGVGPDLNALFGRKAGSVADFGYSRPMQRAGADGLVWTHETLDAFVENPRALVSGNRMSFRGLKDPAQRAALLAFLRAASVRPSDIPESEPSMPATAPVLSPEVLALAGDPAWGEYLSAECTTCHRRDGADEGIPSIVQWPAADFVAAMHAYKQKLRPHPVMQMMAGRLTDEEIAALAAYFAALD